MESHHFTSLQSQLGVLIVFEVVYGVFVLLILTEMIRTRQEMRSHVSRTVIRIFILASFALRMVWVVFRHDGGRSVVSYAANRLCLCTFFTAFIQMIYSWAGASQRHNRCTSRTIFVIVINFIIYVVQLVVGSLQYTIRNGSEVKAQTMDVYDVGILWIACLSFVTAVSFLGYGLRLYAQLRQFPDNAESSLSRAHKVLLIALTFCLLFGLRCFLFIYRFAFQHLLPCCWYPWAFYFVPEVLGAAVLEVSLPGSLLNTLFSRCYQVVLHHTKRPKVELTLLADQSGPQEAPREMRAG